MAKQGWIKVYRKITDSLVWSDPNLLKMWILCLTKASHDESTFNFNGKKILLHSGEFVTGRTAIGAEYNYGAQKRHQISADSSWRLLKKLENMQMLHIKTTTKYSVVTVINWSEYQEVAQHSANNPPTSRQQVATYKNDKNEKNEKKSTTSKSAINFYENNFGVLGPMLIENMNYWISDFKKIGSSTEDANQILIKAMEISIKRNKRSWAYSEAILKDWINKGLNTPGAIDGQENSFQSAKLAHDKKGGSYGGIVF